MAEEKKAKPSPTQLPAESLRAMAEALGLGVAEDTCQLLAEEATYRLKEVAQVETGDGVGGVGDTPGGWGGVGDTPGVGGGQGDVSW
ncbi:hypothetical protein AV530_009538 [Patagioenas fasciata monilis]|uniref:TATA box binding protein associated factor (TAF) histone-like fold domain-containing protein n=1 Tax=Patagioenas fasciata monilis TaxID=372326 RepID=A0A1V4K9S0_PATFA|nr:hypothetical protein AV530_009538 [Patagioenas fasciata monilis]